MTIRDTRKAELKKILKTIDEELTRDQFPLEGRQAHALLRLSQRLQTKIAAHHDDELFRFVSAWYEKKYGSRVKAARTIGVLAILIRGGLYVLFGGPLRRTGRDNRGGSGGAPRSNRHLRKCRERRQAVVPPRCIPCHDQKIQLQLTYRPR